jgi:hypothetical protein
VTIDPNHPLRGALDAAEPKPDARGEREHKKNYAQRLSNELAQLVADALRDHFPNISRRQAERDQRVPWAWTEGANAST